MNINILSIHNCYGCGVCATSCPKKIISIKLNKNGFYEPQILEVNKCIECGICLEVCAFNNSDFVLNNVPICSWAAWSKDEEICKKCSSGGIGFEIGKQLIEQGYQVVGCRYNIKEQRAEHYIATDINELIQSIGSKYIQSYTEEAFKQIKRKGQKYLITGTPCQIDSFRRMIKKFKCEENFVLLDFFCHSVPSMLAWKKYIKMLEPEIGKITYASWRNKFNYGWHDSWLMGMDGEKTSTPVDWHDSYNLLIKGNKSFIQSRKSQGDLFYKLFLGDYCCNPACVKNCKFKYNCSSSDIRIGDLWGNTYKDNDKGVSALVAFTDMGRQIVKSLKNVALIEHSFEVVAEGQMTHNVHKKPTYGLVMFFLKSSFTFNSFAWKLVNMINQVCSKVYNIVKK